MTLRTWGMLTVKHTFTTRVNWWVPLVGLNWTISTEPCWCCTPFSKCNIHFINSYFEWTCNICSVWVTLYEVVCYVYVSLCINQYFHSPEFDMTWNLVPFHIHTDVSLSLLSLFTRMGSGHWYRGREALRRHFIVPPSAETTSAGDVLCVAENPRLFDSRNSQG